MSTVAKRANLAKTKKSRDRAKDMLIRNSMDVLRAFMECSDEMREGVLEMVEIVNDPSTDEDQKAAAESTLIEALYPKYHSEGLGIDSHEYEAIHREEDPETERSLDAQEAAFASKLQKLMTGMNLTQRDLAAKTGVGQPAIANILARQCRPQRRTIEKLAKALQVDPKVLWPFSD